MPASPTDASAQTSTDQPQAVPATPLGHQPTPPATPAPATDAVSPNCSPAQHIDALLQRLSLPDKVALLACSNPPLPQHGLARYDHWTEALHGCVNPDGPSTVYPIPLALAASFNPALVRQVGEETAREAQAAHRRAWQAGSAGSGASQGLTLFAPQINLLRDPRWGRGQETFGECPWLTSRLAVAMVQGLQANGLCCATPKHFAVHSGPEPQRFSFDAQASLHDLHDSYLPAFRAALVEAGAGALMVAYNALNGRPLSVHAQLLDGLVRQAWGFQGVVVSDCNGLRTLHSQHRWGPDEAAALAEAVRSGVDLELYASAQPQAAAYHQALQRGLLNEADLDRALGRSLALRQRLGVLLAEPTRLAAHAAPANGAPMAKRNDLLHGGDDSAPAEPPPQTTPQAHAATALQAAQQSLVLLHNTGTLPLAPGLRHIAVVGPLADDPEVMLGNYNGRPAAVQTVLDGLRQCWPQATLHTARGANVPTTPVDVPAQQLSTDDQRPGLQATVWPGIGPGGAPLAERHAPDAVWTGRHGSGFTRLSGWLTPHVSGRYLLGCHGTGGSRVLLDDVVVAHDTQLHAPRDSLGWVQLQAGQRYRLQVELLGIPVGWNRLVWWREEAEPLAQALAACAQAETVVAVMGLNGRLEGEDLETTEPGFDRGDRVELGLPAAQQALLTALRATGKPLVLVLLSGSALAVPPDSADAILHSFYPGQAGGLAIAQALAGHINPGGRLPCTVYRSASDLPPFESYAMAGRTYRFHAGEVLYPFGHGLGYSPLRHGPARASAERLPAGDSLYLALPLHNDGALAADEVVQAYLVAPAEASPQRWALRAFERLHLPPGQSAEARLVLDARALSTVGPTGQRRVLPGAYRLWLGAGQPNTGAAGQWLDLQIDGELDLPA